MNLPKFLIGDNTDNDSDIFVIHLDYPRFIINLATDEVEWLEDVSDEDPGELASESERRFREAGEFYDREIERIEKDM